MLHQNLNRPKNSGINNKQTEILVKNATNPKTAIEVCATQENEVRVLGTEAILIYLKLRWTIVLLLTQLVLFLRSNYFESLCRFFLPPLRLTHKTAATAPNNQQTDRNLAGFYHRV